MLKIAKYKAHKGDWRDWLIALVTLSRYSHVELVLPNGSFSASPRDGGTRWKKDINFYNGHWDVTRIPISDWDSEKIGLICNSYTGAKYDWLAVVMHPFNKLFQMQFFAKGKEFCSGVSAKILIDSGLLTAEDIQALGVPTQCSPRDISKIADLLQERHSV